jgi:hypothetical protein
LPEKIGIRAIESLRVGSRRVVFEYQIIAGRRVMTCVSGGLRKWIHEVFQSRLLE